MKDKNTIGEALTFASDNLSACGIGLARLEARALVSKVAEIPVERLMLNFERAFSPSELKSLKGYIQRRVEKEPLAYILGEKEFWSLNFLVSPATLIPRPDSETLVEGILEHFPERKSPYQFLDLGTGSGCLLLALLSEYTSSRGVGIDVSESAIITAKKNAKRNDLSDRAIFLESDWNEGLDGFSNRFDVIVSNPPYIPTDEVSELEPEITKYEPIKALDGGVDGLNCFRQILRIVPDLLIEGGAVVFEVGIKQSEAVLELAKEKGFSVVGTKFDLSVRPRVVLLSYAKE